jgi:hypothetical protein
MSHYHIEAVPRGATHITIYQLYMSKHMNSFGSPGFAMIQYQDPI